MNDDQLDLVFGALADRTRRGILARLAQSEAGVNDLTALFTMSQPAISKHLKVLESAGLISRSRQGTGWLGTYREYWEESYDRLDDLLATLDDTEGEPS
jgi:DNA-binding transcriptional ArsR family regulator